jgi:hypothetical protein
MPCGPYSVWLVNIMRQPCRARRCVWPCSSCDPCKTHRGLGQGRWVPRASRPMRLPRCSARQAIRTRAQSALGRFSACPGGDVGRASPVALSGCRCGRRARRHLRFVLRAVSRGCAALPCTDCTTGPTRCTHRRTVALRRGDHGGGSLAAMSIILRPDTGMPGEYSRSLVSGDTGSHAMDGVVHARSHTLAHTRMLSNPRSHVRARRRLTGSSHHPHTAAIGAAVPRRHPLRLPARPP